MKVKLENVTLVAADCKEYGLTISAIKASLKEITPAKTLFFTDIKAVNPQFPFEIVKIDKITSKEEYSKFIIKELWKHITTDYVLIIQHDGYVLDGNAWDNEFLEYDYIGAPWLYIDGRNMGNGGFSLRSKKLMEILGNDSAIEVFHPEDDVIGRLYRGYLEKNYKIKFAPDSLGDRFAFELREPIGITFGFHGKFHEPYKPTVVVRRSGAGGDIILTEPVMEWYHKAGYHVVLDCPYLYWIMFHSHRFPVKHISQFDARVPHLLIDLDMSYENNPKQNHLLSYYQTAGITNGLLKRPQLDFKIGDHNRLFTKYVVMHVEDRDQPSRNVRGVTWANVAAKLVDKGYTVIVVGKTDPYIKNTIWFNTLTSPNMAMYLIAGASGFIGVDSMPSNMAVALNVPAMIFFGSVNPDFIYADQKNIVIVSRHEVEKVCEKPYCWSETIGSVTGTECYISVEEPPCTDFSNSLNVGMKFREFVQAIGGEE